MASGREKGAVPTSLTVNPQQPDTLVPESAGALVWLSQRNENLGSFFKIYRLLLSFLNRAVAETGLESGQLDTASSTSSKNVVVL